MMSEIVLRFIDHAAMWAIFLGIIIIGSGFASILMGYNFFDGSKFVLLGTIIVGQYSLLGTEIGSIMICVAVLAITVQSFRFPEEKMTLMTGLFFGVIFPIGLIFLIWSFTRTKVINFETYGRDPRT